MEAVKLGDLQDPCHLEKFLVFEDRKSKYFWFAALCTVTQCNIHLFLGGWVLSKRRCVRILICSSTLFPFFQPLRELCLPHTFPDLYFLCFFIFFLFTFNLFFTLLPLFLFFHNLPPSLKPSATDTQLMVSSSGAVFLVPSRCYHSIGQE